MDILRRTASGTAASVISSTRSGEGCIYQSVFYPYNEDRDGNAVSWSGQVHSLFIDNEGKMREDTNQDGRLDKSVDRSIKFTENDDGELAIELSDGEVLQNILDIKYVWSSSNWLNELADDDVVSQRAYKTSDSSRYIFTFLNTGRDGVPNGDVVPFECQSTPGAADLKDPTKLYPYIHVSESFGDTPQQLQTLKTDNPDLYTHFLGIQTKRVIDFIRGKDQPALEGDDALTLDAGATSFPVFEFRSRQIDYDADGDLETWRLGDVVYSSPTVATRPSELYHLLYDDASYADFYQTFGKRRSVVYVGANDGMLHAFNAGFYSSSENTVFPSPCDDPCKTADGENCPDECDDCTVCDSNAAPFDLGAEMWAYVPYNLLPHLYWLTKPDYGDNMHVYYVDLKPKLVDAKILPDDAHYADSDTDPNWGTILVAGMRFGGCKIYADIDKTDGFAVKDGLDPAMSSAFVIMDVTDPEEAPVLLGEVNFPGLGFTTCYPAVSIFRTIDPLTREDTLNDWYLIFGSGPAAVDGTAGDPPVLASDGEGAISLQKGRIYILSLNKLSIDKEIWSVDQTGSLEEGLHTFQILSDDDASFISRLLTVDWNLDFKADATYFGTISGDTENPGGKLRRITYDNGDGERDPSVQSNWNGDSLFLDLNKNDPPQPITAAANVGLDEEYNPWVYVGTGRYYTTDDVKNTDQQSMYGLKEPVIKKEVDGQMVLVRQYEDELFEPDDLLNTTDIEVRDDNSVAKFSGGDEWTDLLEAVKNKPGWKMNFVTPGERNLGIASLYAQMLLFTTFLPSENVCEYAGESFVYALYYLTGTSVLGGDLGSEGGSLRETPIEVPGEPKKKPKSISLGKGMTTTVTPKPPPKTPPSSEGDLQGASVLVQKNNAQIMSIQTAVPGWTHSAVAGWRDMSLEPEPEPDP
ncbi:MAG: hypothetical protein GY859_01165 [Desulfobacterales bacterium]|nr:hypothetical protein [Desulfobacterales bacterium]